MDAVVEYQLLQGSVSHYAPVRTVSAKIGGKSSFTPVFDRYPPFETFSSYVQPSNSVHR